MIYTVGWLPSAEAELARIYNAAGAYKRAVSASVTGSTGTCGQRPSVWACRTITAASIRILPCACISRSIRETARRRFSRWSGFEDEGNAMNRVTADRPLLERLEGIMEPVEIRDPDGRVLGRFHPGTVTGGGGSLPEGRGTIRSSSAGSN